MKKEERSKHPAPTQQERHCIEVMLEMQATGEAVTVTAVATRAGVSRAYVYSHPRLMQMLSELRISTDANVLRREIASLRAQLNAATKRLNEEEK